MCRQLADCMTCNPSTLGASKTAEYKSSLLTMTYIVRTCSWSLQVTSSKLHALAAGNAQFSLFWGSICCLSLTKASACWLGKLAATSIGLDGMCPDRFAVHVYKRPPGSQQSALSVEIVLKSQKVRQHSSCIRV